MTVENTSWPARGGILLVIVLPLLSYPLSWLPASAASRALTLPLAVFAACLALIGLAVRMNTGRSGVPAATGPAGKTAESLPLSLPRSLLVPILLWGISLLISVRFSQQPHLSVMVLPVFFSNLCLLWLGTLFPATQLRLLSWCWVATATIIALNGLIRLGSDGAMLSTIGNQNVTAAYLAAAVPLAVALRRRWSYAVAAGLLVALIFCRSRGAWLGLIITAAAGLVILYRHKRAVIGPAVAAVALALAAFGATLWRTDVRPVIWESTTRMIAAQPVVGHGLGTYLVQYPQYRQPEYFARPKAAPVTDHAHNELFEVAAEQGLLGLAATLWLWTAAVRLGWTARSAHPLILGLLGATVVFFVHGLLDVGLRFPPIQPLFWLLLGVLASRGRVTPAAALPDEDPNTAGGVESAGPSRHSEPAARVRRGQRTLHRRGQRLAAVASHVRLRLDSGLARNILAAIACIVAIWMFVAGALDPVRAGWWERRARIAAAAGDYPAGVRSADRALQWQPFRPHLRYFLAQVLSQIPTVESQDAAIAELEQLQELAPDYANVPANLGALLLARGRVAEALPYLQRALESNPYDADARQTLAVALAASP